MAATDALYIDCSTGAPAWANTSAAMKPFNTVKLAGTPGAPVTVSLDGSGVFNINGYKTWSGNLDRSGALELQVFSLQTGLVSLSAYANVLLYDDGTASIDLINSVAESVTLTISLPQASGSTVIDSCVFVTFPPLENLR